jgi:(p)ppGpp synthase/HD superfamily hydrolase
VHQPALKKPENNKNHYVHRIRSLIMSACPGFMDKDPALRLLVIKLAADHASRAHKGQFRKDRKTPYIIHPARVAGLVSMFHGSHVAIIAAWLHDVYEDCSPEWIMRTDEFVAGLPLSDDDRADISAIIDALTKKNTIKDKGARLTDSLTRILDAPPEATLVKLCDRIDNLLDSGVRNGGFTKRYLASTDELIDTLSVRASLYGYDCALNTLVTIRNSRLKIE